MRLHRLVSAVGVAVCLILVALALTAAHALHSTHNGLETSSAVASQRSLLAGAQDDVARSQSQLQQLLVAPRTDSAARVGRAAAYDEELRGLTAWQRYTQRAARLGAVPDGSEQLTRDLTSLRALRVTQQVDAEGRVTASWVARRAQLAERVAADFSAVGRAADDSSAAGDAALTASVDQAALSVAITAALGLAVVVAMHLLLARAARRREGELAQRDRDLKQVANANEFEARLQRALELSPSEDRVFRVVEQALAEVTPDLGVEVLLADSSRAHFQQILATGGAHQRFCSVDSPTHCPAAQRGEVMTFESSEALDACPFLKDAGGDSCSAMCIPVSVSGLTVGVVHATGPHREPPSADGRTALELVARRASDRIGVMRAFSRSEAQASTDSLTGLANRRSVENAARELTKSGTPYALAFGDLDHFKRVNDTYGHGAGDQALRLFARVLREHLRPTDVAGRFGGEEFVLVLPRCDEMAAVSVLERIRERLAAGVAVADCPSFTVSFGLALDTPGEIFEARVARADAALLEAKRQGRNRVVLAGSTPADTAGTLPGPASHDVPDAGAGHLVLTGHAPR